MLKFSLTLNQYKDTLRKRFEAYFSFPPSLTFPSVQIIKNERSTILEQKPKIFGRFFRKKTSSLSLNSSADQNTTVTDNLKIFTVSLIGEHLFPIWTGGDIDRFRTGRYFICPSIAHQLGFLCPVPGKCDGQFPGVRGLPNQCWFQQILHDTFTLSVDEIGIVPGYEPKDL